MTHAPTTTTTKFTGNKNSIPQSTMETKYQAFVTEKQFDRYAEEIGKGLKTESERQVACMIAADLVDPRTGFDAAAGYLCPSLIDFQLKKIERLKIELSKSDIDERITEAEMDEQWEALDESVLMLAFNPFSTAKISGFFDDTEEGTYSTSFIRCTMFYSYVFFSNFKKLILLLFI